MTLAWPDAVATKARSAAARSVMENDRRVNNNFAARRPNDMYREKLTVPRINQPKYIEKSATDPELADTQAETPSEANQG